MIEKLPEGWVRKKVKEIIKDTRGSIKVGPFGSSLSKNEMVKSGIKVYGQENIYKKNFSIFSYFITKQKFEILKSCTLHYDDVVISMMGTVGASAVFPEDS